jgi:3-oxoacyl-[acyl-carrier-protein] synthase III
MNASIAAIEYYLPERISTAQDLAEEFPEWSLQQIAEKTGILKRHIAAPDECSSDLGVCAAQKLFASGACRADDIDFVLFCTQSPDYFLPSTSCVVQDRLGIPQSAGALDFNLGCSGYIYGLGLAKGLIESEQAVSVLLITAETYSKFIHPRDKSVRTIFGDAAAATLVRRDNGPHIGPLVYGTDGAGAKNLIVPAGGMRCRQPAGASSVTTDEFGNMRGDANLFMDGPEVFNFTIRQVPKSIQEVLNKSGLTMDAIDLVVCHQANRYMLEHLRKKLRIAENKFFIEMSHCGNTGSSTIPIALKSAVEQKRLKSGDRLLLAGFGVGYSWGTSIVKWSSTFLSN